MNERAFVVACIEIFTGCVLGILTRSLYLRLKQRQNVALRYLTCTTFFLCLTSVLQLLDQFYFDPFTTVRSVGYGLAFGMSAIANIFMAWFMLEIFASGRASGGWKLSVFMLVEGVVAILAPIFGPLLADLFLVVLLVHLVFALVLYIIFIRVTTSGIQKASDPIARKGFMFLRAGGFTITLAYISFILDNVWLIVFVESYSVWVMLGWLFAATTGVLLYEGFTYPTKAHARLVSSQGAKN